jgi:hypothetical protein
MPVRLWTLGLLLCGLAMLAVAAWQYFSPADGPGLIVEGPDREISDCSVGRTTVVTFLLHNRGRRPVQVIGLAPC